MATFKTKALLIEAMGGSTPQVDIYEFPDVFEAREMLCKRFADIVARGSVYSAELEEDHAIVYRDEGYEWRIYEIGE